MLDISGPAPRCGVRLVCPRDRPPNSTTPMLPTLRLASQRSRKPKRHVPVPRRTPVDRATGPVGGVLPKRLGGPARPWLTIEPSSRTRRRNEPCASVPGFRHEGLTVTSRPGESVPPLTSAAIAITGTPTSWPDHLQPGRESTSGIQGELPQGAQGGTVTRPLRGLDPPKSHHSLRTLDREGPSTHAKRSRPVGGSGPFRSNVRKGGVQSHSIGNPCLATSETLVEEMSHDIVNLPG